MALVTGVAIGAAAASGVAAGACFASKFATGKQRAEEAANTRSEQTEDPPITGWEGFSMEEARAHADAAQAKGMQMAPEQVLAELQRGNTRFWMNCATRPEKSAFERRALISKQFPKVAILGCSDSRVPVEMVFDHGLGDIFVIRVAGNTLDPATLASLQYASDHLGVKVLLVLGHEMCGAVKAALQPLSDLEREPSELEWVLKNIRAGLDAAALQRLSDPRAQDREAVATNVKRQVERLTKDEGIMAKVRSGELILIGAFYEISSGIVDFIAEVSAKTLRGDASPRSPKASKK